MTWEKKCLTQRKMEATPGTVARGRCGTFLQPQTTTTGTNLKDLMCQPMSLMDQHTPAQMAIGKQDCRTFTLGQAIPAVALHTDVAFASV